MSLLTPPSSSHRSEKDKENFIFADISARKVIWAPENSIHCLSTPPKHNSISSKQRPGTAKSILKKSTQNPLLALPDITNLREETPEPPDPLSNLTYLENPVAQILKGQNSLRELVEGYNVLAARLRNAVSNSLDADASWPLFQPLRGNIQAFFDAIIRDLGRAHIDPVSTSKESKDKHPKCILPPSPQSSPAKQKRGMSAEQVKFARDLCATCHSVIKLLGLMFSNPVLYAIFDEKQLSQILTTLIGIPLADELPTINARKTCALVIWLIQSQRLPADVLQPAASRIAYVLRRGLDGELGKEGKKGSTSDGLKAIHDLCTYLPDIFVPAFTPLFPSILANLLAPTFNLRIHACNALGGMVLGLLSIPLSTVHAKVARAVSTHLTTPVLPPKDVVQSPTKSTEALIVRTLRTTMLATDPTHVAQGPVWAICVLTSLIMLMRSRMYTDQKASQILCSLLGLGLRHKKSSVRLFCSLAWRPMIWIYFQPPLPVETDEVGESEVDEDEPQKIESGRDLHRKVMFSTVDGSACISTIAVLLADEMSVSNLDEDARLRMSIDTVQRMTHKGVTCVEGVEVLRRMANSSENRAERTNCSVDTLIPKGLFSANSGLLVVEFKSLNTVVQPLFDGIPTINDIRCLTKEEMSKDWVFRGVMQAWRYAIGNLEMCDGSDIPEGLVEIWTSLLKANVGIQQEIVDDEATSVFAVFAVTYLINLIEDPKLDLRPAKTASTSAITSAVRSTCANVSVPFPTGSATKFAMPNSDDTVVDSGDFENYSNCSNGELRIRLVSKFWLCMRVIFPASLLESAGESLLACLVKHQKELIPDNSRLEKLVDKDDQVGGRARNEWIKLCMDILSVCDSETFKTFWGCEGDEVAPKEDIGPSVWSRQFTSMIWRVAIGRWKELEGHWDGAVVLLGIPFSDKHTWEPSGDDFALCESLLEYTNNKALDDGQDASNVIDAVCTFVSLYQNPATHPFSSVRLVDLLLSHLDAPEMRELPHNLLELIASTMLSTFPLEPRNKIVALWMVRSLTTIVEHCPTEFCLKLLLVLEEGISLWMEDSWNIWTEDELNYNIVPLYQHILLRIQSLPESLATLSSMENMLNSIFCNRIPPLAVEAFNDFWKISYSNLPVPESGWSSTMSHCLRAVGVLPPEVKDIPNCVITTPDQPAGVLPSLPRTPISVSFSTPPTAILKREVLSKIPSPQRPQKVFSTFPIVPSSPPSPLQRRSLSGHSVVRTPLSPIQLCESPPKRRRLMMENSGNDNKENLMVSTSASVWDDIRPISVRANEKKRSLEAEEERRDDVPVVGPSPAKRLKARMRPKNRLPQIPSSTSVRASSNDSQNEPSDETELRSPPVTANLIQPKDNFSNASQKTPMRKIDFSKIFKSRWPVSVPGSFFSNPLKRKVRESDADSARNSFDNRDNPVPPESTLTPAILSSDDDPHFGQVTPHHLISPPLQKKNPSRGGGGRGATTFVDLPGSDDPSDADSPTKEFVVRQLIRQGSAKLNISR